MIRFRVWANARPMGWFGNAAAAFFFEYDPQWLTQPGAFVLAPQFPLAPERYTGALVRNFFENLLPEGDALEDIASALHLRGASNFELLGRLGQELAGVLSLLAPDARPEYLQQYDPLPREVLSQRLAERQTVPLLMSNEATTMSLAGAQDKIGLRLDDKALQLFDSVGRSPTTHILKPDTRQVRYTPSAINEYACMLLARALKLPVPRVWLLRVPEAAYVVERYDRVIAAGNIVGLHQIDGCQMLGHGSGWKYERTGALVSIPKLVKALRDLRVPGSDMRQFQRWVMFNYLIGNADAHAKNVSVLIDEKGFRLAPFYDLLCVRAYGDTGLALFIGDEETFDAVGRHSWEALCEDCGFNLPDTLKEFRSMAAALPTAWAKVRAQIDRKNPLTPVEQELLDTMGKVFTAHCSNAISMTEGLVAAARDERRSTERVLPTVPARLPAPASTVDGSDDNREGHDLPSIPNHERSAMFGEIDPDFSAQFCPGATLGDLAPEAIALFRERWAKKSNDPRKTAWSDAETLRNAELLVDGQLTYAALILLGTHVALGRHLPQAELVFEYRSSEASGPAADREEYRSGFMVWQDALWTKINLRNDRQSYQDDFFRMDLPTFAEVPVREAVLNAVAHRDYRLSGSIFVRQFTKRLEIVSPGGLPPGITPDNIIDEQNPRNRRLAEALEKCGLIERSGQGLNLMVESAVRQGKPLPSFAGTAAHQVRLTLEGGVRNPAFVRFMERVGADTLRNFSTLDYLALECLEQEKALSTAMKERLPSLVAVGVAESVGRGRGTRYMLSEALYASLGAKGTYTRQRGLDRETNKALLLHHLTKQGMQGAPLSELRQVLPTLPASTVQDLLKELRTEGKLELRGERRWARWLISMPQAL